MSVGAIESAERAKPGFKGSQKEGEARADEANGGLAGSGLGGPGNRGDVSDEVIGFARDPRVFERILEHIGRTVKHDETGKKLLFLGALSTYTGEPINIFGRGESGSGKTYVAREVLKLFPKEDVWKLGGLSPKALIHERGKYDDDRKAFVIDLRNKILDFLDAPDKDTIRTLRPIMSHDEEEILYKFTDRRKKGELATVTSIIRGWPSFIFATTQFAEDEQESSRAYTWTPETTKEKIEEVKKFAAFVAKGFHRLNMKDVEAERTLIESFLAVLRQVQNDLHPIIEVPYADEIAENYPGSLARTMRDVDRFLTLVKISAFVHADQRRVIKSLGGRPIILADVKDFESAKEILAHVIEITTTGLSGHAIEFFDKVLKKLNTPLGHEDGLTYAEVREQYEKTFGRVLKRTLLTYYLDGLEALGWIERIEDKNDRRYKRVKVLIGDRPNNLDKLAVNFSEDDLKAYLEARFNNPINSTKEPKKQYDGILSLHFPALKRPIVDFSIESFELNGEGGGGSR